MMVKWIHSFEILLTIRLRNWLNNLANVFFMARPCVAGPSIVISFLICMIGMRIHEMLWERELNGFSIIDLVPKRRRRGQILSGRERSRELFPQDAAPAPRCTCPQTKIFSIIYPQAANIALLFSVNEGMYVKSYLSPWSDVSSK